MKQRYRVDFKRLNRTLLADRASLLSEWLPGGKISGRNYICGNLQGASGASLKVSIDTGAWIDFATGEKGGDLISLYAAIKKLGQVEAAKKLLLAYEPSSTRSFNQ
ncbi:MAG: hypothetical protein VKK42_32310 [Lyngbya sp.]|nr:hypothetical protein [Lyngbya sp.]